VQGVDLVILASVEIALTMVAASVPMLRTLVCDINASRARRQGQDQDPGIRARILNIWQSARGSRSSGNGTAAVMEAGPSCHDRQDRPPGAGMHLPKRQDHLPLRKEAVLYGPMSNCDLVKPHRGGGSDGLVIEMREAGGGDRDRGDDADSTRQLNAYKRQEGRSVLDIQGAPG